MGKYRIEKNTVQETLILPLYGRWLCTQRFPGLFQDSAAAELMEKVDYDFSALAWQAKANGLMQTFGALEVGTILFAVGFTLMMTLDVALGA